MRSRVRKDNQDRRPRLPFALALCWLCFCSLPIALSQGADISLDQIRQLIAKDDFKAAETALRQYRQTNKDSADGGFLLGYVLLRLNQPKESLAEYTQAAKLSTPSAEDLRNVADDYALLNDFPDADKWMLRAVRMNDKDPDTWYKMGRIRYSEQRFQDAVICFQKALALEPRSVKAENNLALAYEGLNRTEDATKAYRRAIDWQKGAPHPSEQPLLNLSIILIDEGNAEEAIPLLKQAVEIAPQDPKIHDRLGQAYSAQNKLADAQREFEAAIALVPDNAAYHYLLGRVFHQQGEEQKAKGEFERAAALNGAHATPDTH
jgi:tetratricopeptide (TPR) repeat protein